MRRADARQRMSRMAWVVASSAGEPCAASSERRLLHHSKPRRPVKSAVLICMVEPDLRAQVERHAELRKQSISSTIRALIWSSLSQSNSEAVQ